MFKKTLNKSYTDKNYVQKGMWLKNVVGKNGYASVKLRLPSQGIKLTKVHRIVALSFLPNPNKLPQVNHRDGNKLNNDVDNLEWCTQSENSMHAVKMGLMVHPKGELSPMAKLTFKKAEEIRKKYAQGGTTHQKLAEEYGVVHSQISKVLHYKRYVSWSMI